MYGINFYEPIASRIIRTNEDLADKTHYTVIYGCMHVGFFCKAHFGTLLHLLQKMWWLVGTMEILLIFDETNSMEANPKSLQNHKNYISQKRAPYNIIQYLFLLYSHCMLNLCSPKCRHEL